MTNYPTIKKNGNNNKKKGGVVMGQLLVDGRFSIEVPRFFNIIIKNNNTLITW